jgi:hypothetical protein
MIAIPESEKERFISVLYGQAQRFGLTPEEYLRKVWYHEEASRFGEYIAMTLLEELLPLIPEVKSGELEKSTA